MNKSAIIFITISLITLISCSTIPRTICPEDQYKNLNNIPIYLTTKDTVTLFSEKNNQSISTNGKLNDILIKNYHVDSNLIIAEIAKRKAKIKFSKIKKIEFDGICDKDAGIINENELKDNMGYGRTFLGILFGAVGLYAGAGISQLVNPIHFNFSNKRNGTDFNAIATLLEISAGSTAGAILGYNLGFKIDLNSALEKIRKKRIHGKSVPPVNH